MRTKASIVARDPHEHGERKTLNLGHTFAHAIEHAAGYGKIPHGIAVAAGITLALRASSRLCRLEDHKLPARVAAVFDRLDVPHELGSLRRVFACELEPRELVEGLRRDKKSRAGTPRLVLPKRAGAIEIDVEVETRELAYILSGSG